MGDFADKLAAKPLFYQRAYLGSLLPNYVKSGNLEKYYQRLTDFNFLMAKIQHPEFGVQALIDDFNLIDDLEAIINPDYNPEKARSMELIQSVLWMSGDILELDKTKLAEQLLGRLLYFEVPSIQSNARGSKKGENSTLVASFNPLFHSSPRRITTYTWRSHKFSKCSCRHY